MPPVKKGYRKDFLGKECPLVLPVLNSIQKKDLAKYEGRKYVLNYTHFSIVVSKSRRFAYYTAVNIDGKKWKNNPRKGTWKKEKLIKEQYGLELYNAPKSDFDRGHLVRREDPEWGDIDTAINAGKETFIYPNCVPQHKKLNQDIWAELESNILHKGANDQKLKISVFSGPVLSENDGIFVTKVHGLDVKIPNLFWKIVIWKKTDGKIYAVGFIQSQEKFLIDDQIIRKLFVPARLKIKKLVDEDIFEHLKFKDGKTYQVRIEEIENLTGLEFEWPEIIKPYKKATPTRIKVSRKKYTGLKTKVSIKGFVPMRPRHSLENLVLG
jgi:endonuclease G